MMALRKCISEGNLCFCYGNDLPGLCLLRWIIPKFPFVYTCVCLLYVKPTFYELFTFRISAFWLRNIQRSDFSTKYNLARSLYRAF
jgi:hypothetical protein